jgi:hypothetical protein
MSPGTIRRIKEGPRMFQLGVNYRSHGGIVNCAHSVIELITHFWPYSIDRLAPEQGIVDGVKPIFLTAQDQDTATYKQFLFDNKWVLCLMSGRNLNLSILMSGEATSRLERNNVSRPIGSY